jgi:signal transduction histidine kinase/ligand-binding sensor domain-containing protein
VLICLASFVIALSQADSAKALPITQLVHTKWTAKDGAPNDIRDLAQTTDGYLWLGSSSGLTRFDGVRFVHFTPRYGETLPVAGVGSLLAARDGGLWIVWRSGQVSRLRDGRLTTYGEHDGLPVAFHVAESGTGVVVAGTATGMARFGDGKWKDISREWGYPDAISRALWFDREGALWTETEKRVLYLPAGGSRFVDPEMPLRRVPYNADFAEQADGTVWIAEVGRSAHTVPRVGERAPVSEVMVGTWTLLIDRKGSLWVGSAGDGLRRVVDVSRIRGKKVGQFGAEAEQFTEKDGLLSNVVTALLEDRDGGVWVATSGGVERFREGSFTPIVTHRSRTARQVRAGRDSSVWTTAYNEKGAYRLSHGRTDLLASGFIPYSVFADALGNVWTFDAARVFRLEGRRFTPIAVRARGATRFTDITVDRDGSLWVFDERLGLLRLGGDSLTPVGSLAQSAFPHAYLYGDRQGRVWVGQQNRIAVYDHGRIRTFDAAKGDAPADINGFFEDRAGTMWVACNAGVSRFENGRFRALPERQAVPGRTVLGMTADDGGAWWLVTRGGVLRLPPGELERAFADSAYHIQYRTFDELDGLPGSINSTFWGPMVTRAADGRIWVGTDGGVAYLDPRNITGDPAPPALVEGLRVDGREQRPSDGLAVPPGRHDLEIDYTTTTLARPERVEFRYRLDGQDPDWREVGTRRRAYYTGLAPGAYTFRVSATSGDGDWNDAGGTTWTFRVLPTWYQTLWFRVGGVLLISGIGAATAALVQRRRHVQSRADLERQHQATMAERARIAQDLHDSLLQGFTGITFTLRAIQRRLAERPWESVAALNDVAGLAETTLRDARRMIWDMRTPELDQHDLPRAIEQSAERLVATAPVRLVFETIGAVRRVPAKVEMALFRIARESVANALRHAEAATITISLAYEPNLIRLTVHDDGRGFVQDQEATAADRGHMGLSGIRERARDIGATVDISSSGERGTTVTVVVPESSMYV